MDVVTLALAKQYTDKQRLGYSTISEENPKTIELNEQGPDGKTYGNGTFAFLKEGNQYRVVTDSGNYVCTCKFYESNGDKVHSLGNFVDKSVGANENTGESFYYIEVKLSGMSFVQCQFHDLNGGTTGTIYELTEHVNRIDPKYLPEGMGSISYENAKVFENAELMFTEGAAQLDGVETVKIGDKYTIVYDGVTCDAVGVDYYGTAAVMFNDVPVLIYDMGEGVMIGDTRDLESGVTESTHNVTLYGMKPIYNQINPNLIPAMDFLTLNGAGGKQYAITVNESGALTATAIE